MARHAVARLLDIEPDDEALTRSVLSEVVQAADQPFVEQTRQEPWEHLDRDHLAAVVKRSRRTIDARRGGPCLWCGRTLNTAGKQWWPLTGPSGSKTHPGFLCDPCQEFRTDLRVPPAAVTNRDLIAANLIGWSTRQKVVYSPGLATAVGLRLWCDLTDPDFECRDKGFVWVDRQAMQERASAWRRGDLS